MARPTNSLASPVCFLHELQPDTAGGFAAVDPQQRRDVARFRRAERGRLTAARIALGAATRATLSARIAAHPTRCSAICGCRRSPDAVPRRIGLAGLDGLAMPAGRSPRCRWPGAWPAPRVLPSGPACEALRPGLDIRSGGGWRRDPVGGAGALVGFDRAHRLGYGGGFFDRCWPRSRPRASGWGSRCRACRPSSRSRDIPMTAIVTEDGVLEGPPGAPDGPPMPLPGRTG